MATNTFNCRLHLQIIFIRRNTIIQDDTTTQGGKEVNYNLKPIPLWAVDINKRRKICKERSNHQTIDKQSHIVHRLPSPIKFQTVNWASPLKLFTNCTYQTQINLFSRPSFKRCSSRCTVILIVWININILHKQRNIAVSNQQNHMVNFSYKMRAPLIVQRNA